MQSIINQIKELNHRPTWDEYFMSVCYLICQRSSCDRLHVGCVLVKDKHIISSGYNGHLAGAPHESIIITGHEQMTIHAETNATTDAAKRGVSIDGCTAYITHYPCINCTKVLAASGIKIIIYGEDYKNDDIVLKLCKSGDIKLYKFDYNTNDYFK